MSVTYQHHQSVDILFSDCPTGDTKTLWMERYGNQGVGLDSAVNYADTVENTIVGSITLSSRAQGIKWASNHHAAVRYAVDIDGSL